MEEFVDLGLDVGYHLGYYLTRLVIAVLIIFLFLGVTYIADFHLIGAFETLYMNAILPSYQGYILGYISNAFLPYFSGFMSGTILVSFYTYLIMHGGDEIVEIEEWMSVFLISGIIVAGVKWIPVVLSFVTGTPTIHGTSLTVPIESLKTSFYYLPIILLLVLAPREIGFIDDLWWGFIENSLEKIIDVVPTAAMALLASSIILGVFFVSSTFFLEILIL